MLSFLLLMYLTHAPIRAGPLRAVRPLDSFSLRLLGLERQTEYLLCVFLGRTTRLSSFVMTEGKGFFLNFHCPLPEDVSFYPLLKFGPSTP